MPEKRLQRTRESVKCPYCHKSMLVGGHISGKLINGLGMWVVGCPKFPASTIPMFLENKKYKIVTIKDAESQLF